MGDEIVKHARILVVDDEPQNVRYLEDVLQWAGYSHVESTSDPFQALPLFRRFQPDLVILDLLMPGMDGFAVLEEIREQLEPGDYLPVLVLTSDVARETRRRALAAGARDFLTKPMSPTEVRHRVANLLEARFLYLRCRELERGTGAPARAGADGNPDELLEILERWAASAQDGSPEAGRHAKRVAWTAARLAAALDLPEEDVTLIHRAAMLHDIGKAAVGRAAGDGNGGRQQPAAPEHAAAGAELLAGGRSPLLRLAEEIALCHHERWDGQGYPRGLAGEEIPLAARIVAVADRLDHLTYGPGPKAADALEHVEKEAGTRFDPRVVEALLRMDTARQA